MKLDELSAEADKLSEDERASLAARLLHGLEKPHYSVSDEEVLSRVREAEANPEVMITFDQLVSGLRFLRVRETLILHRRVGNAAEIVSEKLCGVPSSAVCLLVQHFLKFHQCVKADLDAISTPVDRGAATSTVFPTTSSTTFGATTPAFGS